MGIIFLKIRLFFEREGGIKGGTANLGGDRRSFAGGGRGFCVT
jgi:hypothetical protein